MERKVWQTTSSSNRRTVAAAPRVLRLGPRDSRLARVAVNVAECRDVGKAGASLARGGEERVGKVAKGPTLDDVAHLDKDANGACRGALRVTPRAVGRVDGGDAQVGERGRGAHAHGEIARRR